MAMIDLWTSATSQIVARLYDQALSGPQTIAQVAQRTKGLPVYLDMGGSLVLMSSGEVIEYQFESESISAVTDSGSLRLAAIAAAQLYPELEALRPPRGARCPVCTGTGTLAGVRCGECSGDGYLPP
jgi:hypothetical protein